MGWILTLKIKFVVEEVGTRNRGEEGGGRHQSTGLDKYDIICLP